MGRGNLAAVLAAIVACLSLMGGLAGASERAQARGDLVTEGTLAFPPGTALELAPFALVVEDAARLQDFELTTPRLRVCVGEATYTEADAGGTLLQLPLGDFRFSCHVVTNAFVRTSEDGDNAGWLGLYPRDGTRLLSGESSLTRRTLSAVASPDMNGAATNDDEQPAWPFYHRRIPEDHFVLSSLGPLEVTGPGALKLKGPDVRVEASENATTYATQDTASSSAPARERFMRWLFVEWGEGTLRLTAPPGAVTAAVSNGTASWDGRLTFQAVAGSVTDAAGVEHGAARGRGWLEGRFTGSVAPLADETGRLRFEGELRGSSFEARAPAAPPVAPRVPALEAALVGAVLVGGGAAVALLVRRNAATAGAARGAASVRAALALDPVGAREYELRGDEATDEERWPEAADLYRAARAKDPARAVLARKEGMALLKADRLREALCAFDNAALLENHGEAETWAALCALRMSLEDEAADYLKSALQRVNVADYLPADVERQPGLVGLLARPDVARAWEDACRRVSARPQAPEDDDESEADL